MFVYIHIYIDNRYKMWETRQKFCYFYIFRINYHGMSQLKEREIVRGGKFFFCKCNPIDAFQ